MRKLTTSDFIAKANLAHDNKYDYSLVNYVKNNVKVIIICPIHGEFQQTPGSHLLKVGCPLCGGEKKEMTRSNKSDDEKREIQAKKRLTNLNKTDAEKQAAVDKQRQTCSLKSDEEKQVKFNKMKQTNLERWGAEFPLQSRVCHDKFKRTMVERHGAEYSGLSNKLVYKKDQTCLEKFGTIYHSQKHMINILTLLENKDWMVEQYTTLLKTQQQIGDELGCTQETISKCLYRHRVKIRQTDKHSYKCSTWLKSKMKDGDINIKCHKNGGEYRIPGSRFKADGYCAETNTIYEFHGDYWHGNPEVYESEEWNRSKKRYMGQIYQDTIEREEKIKKLGYNLVVMWEHDWNKINC